jgi:Planctomycete cytochrome C
VVLVTAIAFGIMTLFRPTMAYPVKEWLGLERRPRATPNSFYSVRIAPLFDEHCAGCHGSKRQKAKLRLDSYANVVRGGKHGQVIKAGNLHDSELFARLTLPASNARAMPPDSKPPLTADEVTVVRLWITAGASGVQPVDQIKGAPKPLVQVKFAEIDEVAVAKARAPLAVVVDKLQSRYPNVIEYESRASVDLEVNASLMNSSFGDADLSALGPLSDHIVWADLSGTAVTDASATVLATMKQLRVLRLMNTKITDATVHALVGLNKLRSLTVVGTAVTESSLLVLKRKKIQVYDGNDVQDSFDGKR